jgi:hypothetical protein
MHELRSFAQSSFLALDINSSVLIIYRLMSLGAGCGRLPLVSKKPLRYVANGQ